MPFCLVTIVFLKLLLAFFFVLVLFLRFSWLLTNAFILRFPLQLPHTILSVFIEVNRTAAVVRLPISNIRFIFYIQRQPPPYIFLLAVHH